MTEKEKVNIKEEIDKHTSAGSFDERFYRVLEELKALDAGVFDDTEAKALAAACLRAQIVLSKMQTAADARAKHLKKDIDFEKAAAYVRLKKNPPKDFDKKLTETALVQLVNMDDKVLETIRDHIDAEKEAKDLSNLLGVLGNAHVTFRTIIKKGE